MHIRLPPERDYCSRMLPEQPRDASTMVLQALALKHKAASHSITVWLCLTPVLRLTRARRLLSLGRSGCFG